MKGFAQNKRKAFSFDKTQQINRTMVCRFFQKPTDVAIFVVVIFVKIEYNIFRNQQMSNYVNVIIKRSIVV